MARSKLALFLATTAFLVLMVACGLSQADVERIADERVATALAQVPTATAEPTMLPTATPMTFLDSPTEVQPQPSTVLDKERILDDFRRECSTADPNRCT